MSVTLIKTTTNNHVSTNTVIEFENIFEKQTTCNTIKETKFKLLYKLIERNKLLSSIFGCFVSVLTKRGEYFTVLMGISRIRKTLPHFYNSRNIKSIYLFDTWENRYKATQQVIDKFNIQNIFISSKQATEHFVKTNPKRKVVWVPEAISPINYHSKNYRKKSIDILQIGRKNESYHQAIVEKCILNNINYLFEKEPGKIIFPDQKSFFDGLANSKISICFTSNITHPESRGTISTMTQRYLQSMLSKCLIVGNIPYDMNYLFDYVPLIEADMKNPYLQLKNILENFDEYIPLIEKNYKNVINNHTWQNRIDIIEPILFSDK